MASGAGRRKSICCLPKAGPMPSRRATLPCRSRLAGSSAMPSGQAKSRSANGPRLGARIGERRQCSPGTATTMRVPLYSGVCVSKGVNVKRIDLYFLLLAVILLIGGVVLGIFMAMNKDYQLAPVHAHVNLV